MVDRIESYFMEKKPTKKANYEDRREKSIQQEGYEPLEHDDPKHLEQGQEEAEEDNYDLKDEMGVGRKKHFKETDAKLQKMQDDNERNMMRQFYEKFFMTWVKDTDVPDKVERVKPNELGGNFSPEEIELIACALKNQLKEARHGLKNLDILMKKPKFEELQEYVDQYQLGMRIDLESICKRQIRLLNEFLGVCITTSELILFTKLKADIHRYLAEHGPQGRTNSRQDAKEEYARAVYYCQ